MKSSKRKDSKRTSVKLEVKNNTFYVMDIETNTAWGVGEKGFVPVACWMFLGCLLKSDETYMHFHNWDEYRALIDDLPEGSIIFVHNLAYEFEYLCRNGFHFTDIIANDRHHPITVKDAERNIKYRCSYKLLDKSVKTLGKELGINKLDYEYHNIRDSSELSSLDYEYNMIDCLIVARAIKKELSVYGDLDSLPLTKTGKVRKLLREKDTGELASRASRAFTDESMYDMLELAFVGGFTYGNPEYFGRVVNSVKSFDRKSAYPATMLKERFPQRFSPIYEGEKAVKMYSQMRTQHYVAEFHIERMVAFDSRLCVISAYKVRGSGNRVLYNGKIYSAVDVTITCDSVSWGLYQKIYNFEGVVCKRIAVATSVRRLPTPLLRVISELAFEKERLGKLKKTTDESSSEYNEITEEYQRTKEMLNSLYGANVQRLRNFDYSVDEVGEWSCTVQEYTKPRGIMRAFAWGVWIAAYSRKALIEEILNVGLDNFVYCDTDSIKCFGDVKIKPYYDKDDVEYLSNLLGEHFVAVKDFGKFEYEDTSSEFLHYGAKKYFTVKGGKFKYTVAGLPKGEKVKNRPKGFADVYPGKCYEDVKLARVLLDNTYRGEMYEKTDDGFVPWNGSPSGGGGVALKETDYTLNVTHTDTWYVKDWGNIVQGFVSPITIGENIDRTEYLLERLM